jgi:hypothetical protein
MQTPFESHKTFKIDFMRTRIQLFKWMQIRI